MVSNTAQLPAKPNQVAKAGRLEGKPKSSLQIRIILGENKIRSQN